MDLQRYLVWIVLGVVLLLGVVGYFVFTPGSGDLGAVMTELEQRESEMTKAAKDASKADSLKSAAHVRAAREYGEKVKTQIADLKTHWSAKAVSLKFESVPQDDAQFNIWLDKTREEMRKQLEAAKVRLPKEFDDLTFKDPSTDSKSTDAKRHRDVRLKYLAVIDEIVAALCKKVAKVQALGFEPDQGLNNPLAPVEAGAFSWDNIKFYDAKEVATSNASFVKDALSMAGKAATPPPPAGKGPPPPVELPLSVFACELEFSAPAPVVPAILKMLEGSQRYYAVIARIDTKRLGPAPFPRTDEVASLGAGPVPGVNTHFQEAPIKVLVTLNIYEFDKVKDETFNKVLDGGAQPQAPAKVKK